MVVNIERLYSQRAKGLKASDIRETLKLTQVPGLISLAGGLPNPKAFPKEVIMECIKKVYENDIDQALQYGRTEGVSQLRRAIAKRMTEKKGIECTRHDLLITAGAQQALTMIAFTFLDPGDTYLSTAPSYLGALQAFQAYGANCEAIPMIEEGIDIERLKRNIERLRRTGVNPKFLYIVPTFQNPSGETITLENRKALLEVASDYDFLIIEDDPYSELIFEGESLPSIKSMDTKGRVIYLSTFSKILAPGFRLGWIIASEEVRYKLAISKQPMDLGTNSFAQYIAYYYIKGGYLDDQLKNIRALYKRKRDVMLEALEEYLPKEAKWTHPNGGLFLWVTLPKEVNTRHMFEKAVANKVAYVVGDAFFPDKHQNNCLRLNFSFSSDEDIKEGVKRLAKVIDEELVEPDDDEELAGTGV